mmetsp:Transcript_34977/g.94804  ORF Transcript_34977/g.94804 Transcript_34977/m.94804 type:complete len:349 (-) Transcript_34977:18-1064(-)
MSSVMAPSSGSSCVQASLRTSVVTLLGESATSAAGGIQSAREVSFFFLSTRGSRCCTVEASVMSESDAATVLLADKGFGESGLLSPSASAGAATSQSWEGAAPSAGASSNKGGTERPAPPPVLRAQRRRGALVGAEGITGALQVSLSPSCTLMLLIGNSSGPAGGVAPAPTLRPLPARPGDAPVVPKLEGSNLQPKPWTVSSPTRWSSQPVCTPLALVCVCTALHSVAGTLGTAELLDVAGALWLLFHLGSASLKPLSSSSGPWKPQRASQGNRSPAKRKSSGKSVLVASRTCPSPRSTQSAAPRPAPMAAASGARGRLGACESRGARVGKWNDGRARLLLPSKCLSS